MRDAAINAATQALNDQFGDDHSYPAELALAAAIPKIADALRGQVLFSYHAGGELHVIYGDTAADYILREFGHV